MPNHQEPPQRRAHGRQPGAQLSRYSPDALVAIIASVERGSSLRQAAIAAGFSSAQVDEWFHIARGNSTWRDGSIVSDQAKAFALAATEQASRAIAARVTVLTSSLYHNATTQNAKTGWFDTQAADKLLSKSPDTREEWFEHRQTTVEQTGTVSIVHQQVRALPDHELLALAAALEQPEDEETGAGPMTGGSE